MPYRDKDSWTHIIDRLDYAYQPIVNIFSGIVYGYEILIRNYEQAGFQSQRALLDAAVSDQILAYVDLEIRKRSVLKFLESGLYDGLRLFYRFDKRVISMPDYAHDSNREYSKSVDVLADLISLELSEKYGTITSSEINSIMTIYRDKGYNVGIDDYGTGCFSFRMLYGTTPDFIKIDRFFISSIEKNLKKKQFVTNMVKIANMFGITVIAKGIETKGEYYTCKEIGIPLIQGFLVREPEINLKRLRRQYDHIEELNNQDKRMQSSRKNLEDKLEYIPPIYVDEEMVDILEKFRRNKHLSFLPVLDKNDMPLGVVNDKELKDFVYSAFGTSLLKNKSAIKSVEKFMTRCAVADIHAEIEQVLEIFTNIEESIGVLITDNSKYVGFMGSRALLNALNDKNLAIARDQNPLTKLPGNNIINSWIAGCLDLPEEPFMFAYFDFDNFKPFNDKYGFRNGDRAIMLFADILKEDLKRDNGFFVGHIGGDDFFAGIQSDMEFEEFYRIVEEAIFKFKHDVESFYSEDDRARGSVILKDREGIMKEFPLLAISAGIVHLTQSDQTIVNQEMDDLLARLKKAAKKSSGKLASACIICNQTAETQAPVTQAEVQSSETTSKESHAVDRGQADASSSLQNSI